MSRKHNTVHNRSASHYPERLSARGLSRAPEMPTLEWLQAKAARQAAAVAAGTPVEAIATVLDFPGQFSNLRDDADVESA